MSSSISSTTSSQFAALIQSTLAYERLPLTRLQETKTALAAQRTAFNDLKTKLRALRTAIDGFRLPGALSPLNRFQAHSGDESVLSATASGSAAAGAHTLTIQTLAQAHAIGSTAFAGDETATLSGSYTFQITIDGEATEITAEIEAGATWREALQAAASAIDGSDAEVTASVVTPDGLSGTARLLLTSEKTGTQAIISEVADTSGDLTSVLGLAGTSTVESYSANTLQTAANAEFTLDGLAFVATSNRVTGALPGVTLDLRTTTTAPVALTIERDNEEVRAGIEKMLTAVNELIDYVRTQTAPADENGEGRGVFAGDTLFTSLLYNLRTDLTAGVDALIGTGNLERLAEIGITSDREGHLKISDAEALEQALSSRPDEVEQLFRAEDGGIAQRVVERIDYYVNADGLIGRRTNAIVSRVRLLDNEISQIEKRLEKRAEQLNSYYANLESAYQALLTQQSMFESMYSS